MNYRKIPLHVEAIQWNNLNYEEIGKFIGKKVVTELESETAYLAGKGTPIFSISIETKEGIMKAFPGDYIIKEPFPTGDRDFYPCKQEIFEKTYKACDQLKEFNFGEAIQLIKAGLKVGRSGWNGKGMYIYYVPANSYPSQTDIAKAEFGDMVPYGAYIAMKTALDNVVPWLASQTDILANDWEVVK